jgi:large subunit ribosomal protein L10
MKKIGLVFKETSEKEIKDNLKGSQGFFVVKYAGLSSPDISGLREALKSARARLFVVKNTVARRAFKDSGLEGLMKSIEGPCGIVFLKDEPVACSKAIYDFSKGHEALKLEGGFLKDKPLQAGDIEAMAKLPPKEVLRAQVVMTLNSPIQGFALVLNQLLAKFVICLDQIRQKKTK